MPILFGILAVLLIPHEAFAWGAGIHLQLGSAVINNLQVIRPDIASLIAAYPHDFLYGCLAADITIGKKFTHYLLHCTLRIGLKVLDNAELPPRSRAPSATGASGSGHHSAQLLRAVQDHDTFPTLTLKHAYWEMRFDHFVDRDVWEMGKKVSMENYRANDALLRRVISDTIFSFGTNKRIFNSILLVTRLEKWQQVLKTLDNSSRFALEETDREEYMNLAQEAVFDILTRMDDSIYFAADPTGERALATAEAVRKNLRLLYQAGKISKEEAFEQVDEMKGKLREAVCDPVHLLQIMSGT